MDSVIAVVAYITLQNLKWLILPAVFFVFNISFSQVPTMSVPVRLNCTLIDTKIGPSGWQLTKIICFVAT